MNEILPRDPITIVVGAGVVVGAVVVGAVVRAGVVTTVLTGAVLGVVVVLGVGRTAVGVTLRYEIAPFAGCVRVHVELT